MAGDYSRSTFNPRKHYLGVLEQQGRVRTDAEANEDVAIRLHRTETESTDVVGACGVPKNNPGFGLSLAPGGNDLIISSGRMYVEGRLCESDTELISGALERGTSDRVTLAALFTDGRPWVAGQWVSVRSGNHTATVQVTGLGTTAPSLTLSTLPQAFPAGPVTIRRVITYLTQPYYPNPEFSSAGPSSPPVGSPPSSPPASQGLVLAGGDYLAYIEVWDREVTALEDPRIREVALAGPDTTTRLQNLWRIRLLPLAPSSPPASPPTSPPSSPPTCDNVEALWEQFTAPATGRMNARTTLPSPPDNLCELPPGTGYRRLENQLYRVEVHQGGDRSSATFKWSRDNGTVVSSIESVSGTNIVVTDFGKDRFLSFADALWVEIYDDESELKSEPRALLQVASVDADRREIVVTTSLAALQGRSGLKLRRWDQTGSTASSTGIQMTGAWLALEDGIQVQFSNGTYRSGDHWLIPGRTGIGEIEWPPFEIPNNNPMPQPPNGVRRRYCRIAIAHVGANGIEIEDCRRPFPPLSEICAEDICFDNTHCDFEGVETVQEAIDRLCEARDLRFHNKHLHGKGVVCGLRVRCGPNDTRPRRFVTVSPGYAIDCEGRDIVLDNSLRLDITDMVSALPSPPPAPAAVDEEYLLRIDLGSNGEPTFSLEPAPATRNPITEILDGTLLRDFIERCVRPVILAFNEALNDSPPTGSSITTRDRRISAVTTVAAPVFGSAATTQPLVSREDHDTLVELYEALRRVLRSSTYCALFDNARPMPDYPFTSTGIRTIYGTSFQNRVALASNGQRAYTYGANNAILVSDLARNEVIETSTFPSTGTVRVNAVAASANGRLVYAAAESGTDTAFAVADVVSTGLKWRNPTILCGVRITSMAVSGTNPEKLYAVAAGKGFYEINPDNPEPKPQPKHAFNATGDLAVLATENFAYATASSGTDATNYDQVVRIPLRAGDTRPPQVFTLKQAESGSRGSDGFALAVQGRGQARLMVAVEGPNGGDKRALVFDALAPEPSRAQATSVSLDTDEPVTLGFNRATNQAVVAHQNTHQLTFFDPVAAQPIAGAFPAGVSPQAIVADVNGADIYVANAGSSSLSRFPADRLQPAAAPTRQQLIEYRARVLEAFADLLGATVQHIKDCFCDLTLINCPRCAENDRLYLAAIRVRGREVIQICNHEGRQHVHTFPKFFYWLSLVPVVPTIGYLIERLCCLAFPEITSRYQAPRPSANPSAGSGFTVQGLSQAVAAARRVNVSEFLRANTAKLSMSAAVLQDAAITQRTPQTGLAQTDLAGLDVAAANEKLKQAGLNEAAIEEYNPKRPAGRLVDIARLPSRLQPGDRITLVTDKGVVRYARITSASALSASTSDIDAKVTGLAEELTVVRAEAAKAKVLEEEVARLKTELTEARDRSTTELDDVRKKFSEEVETREKRIATLEDRLKTSEESVKLIAQLRKDVDALRPRPEKK